MTSRRKAKRADWVWSPGWTIVGSDGESWQAEFKERWYTKKSSRFRRIDNNPEPMYGCVKKHIQQKHRGSWSGIGINPWYNKGLISWRRYGS